MQIGAKFHGLAIVFLRLDKPPPIFEPGARAWSRLETGNHAVWRLSEFVRNCAEYLCDGRRLPDVGLMERHLRTLRRLPDRVGEVAGAARVSGVREDHSKPVARKRTHARGANSARATNHHRQSLFQLRPFRA